MPGVIGHIHFAFTIKPNTIANACARQRDEHLRHAGRRDAADGVLSLEIDGENVAFQITGWALDAGGKGVGDGERRRRVQGISCFKERALAGYAQ